MSRNRRKRLEAVGEHIASSPLARAVVEAAYEDLRSSGELPDDQRLAEAVVERALRREDVREEKPLDYEAGIDRLEHLIKQLEAGELPPSPWFAFERFLRQAVRGSGATRRIARRALKLLAESGLDPSDPRSLEDPVVPPAAIALVRQLREEPVEAEDASSKSVGPPMPKGQALLDHMKAVVRFAREFFAANAATGSSKAMVT
jgi:hypothetical protein